MLGNSQPKGGSVALTIDPDGAEGGVRRARGRSARTSQGAVVALEPRTGKILAMVARPTYDPNRLASPRLQRGAARPTTQLNADQDRAAAQPRRSRTIYPPGSTFKLVTAAAALESGKYTPTPRCRAAPTLDLPQTDAPTWSTRTAATAAATRSR